MKQVVAVICIALVSVGAAVASTGKAGKKAVWTESKAERFVLDGATVRLATEDRVALEAELRPAAALYKALALESTLTGYIHGRERVLRGGVRILARPVPMCAWPADRQRGLHGIGRRGQAGLRFSTFRCNVVSESLEIPAFGTEIGEPADDEQSRTIGPIEAELDVRVTGTSSFAWRKL